MFKWQLLIQIVYSYLPWNIAKEYELSLIGSIKPIDGT